MGGVGVGDTTRAGDRSDRNRGPRPPSPRTQSPTGGDRSPESLTLLTGNMVHDPRLSLLPVRGRSGPERRNPFCERGFPGHRLRRPPRLRGCGPQTVPPRSDPKGSVTTPAPTKSPSTHWSSSSPRPWASGMVLPTRCSPPSRGRPVGLPCPLCLWCLSTPCQGPVPQERGPSFSEGTGPVTVGDLPRRHPSPTFGPVPGPTSPRFRFRSWPPRARVSRPGPGRGTEATLPHFLCFRGYPKGPRRRWGHGGPSTF